MTASKPMTSEQLDDLMTVAVNMQRDSEKACDRPSAMFAYAVQVAVLELQKVRDDSAALAAENAGLKAAKEIIRHLNVNREEANFCGIDDCYIDDAVAAMITPATDAFMAEVRASGVEMFAERKNNEMMSLHPDTHAVGSIAAEMSSQVKQLREFADQLRKGVQS
jgi:hypothetical protein